ncbi:MAG: hypothetical protein IH971_01705 [Candidatus Marinimicrobia bacterium]|nr:hypothetical protein [Candidatus Neomarinimicrobiota bacterium]
MPRAFVIMPFDKEFDAVYAQFIKPALEKLGFEVFRADDIQNQRSILQDIVVSLSESDLVIADLTGGNENVFYELGLAHALQRPVIHLTQDSEEIPFDLKPYRFVSYSTHFAEIDTARSRLSELASGFLSGGVRFGNPITDFLPHHGGSVKEPADQTNHSTGVPNLGVGAKDPNSSDERGFLDHVADMEEGFLLLTDIINDVGEEMDAITAAMNRGTKGFKNSESAAHSRAISRSIAIDIDRFALKLEEANVRYSEVTSTTSNSLEFIISFFGNLIADNPETGHELISVQLEPIRELLEKARAGRDSFANLSVALDQIPKIERFLNKATSNAAKQVRRLVDNVEMTIASASRAIEVGDSIIRDLGSAGDAD